MLRFALLHVYYFSYAGYFKFNGRNHLCLYVTFIKAHLDTFVEIRYTFNAFKHVGYKIYFCCKFKSATRY